MEEAEGFLKDLYHLHDHYFPANKKEKQTQLQQLQQAVLQSCAAQPQDNNDSSLTRARYYYVKGKAYDACGEYDSRAEEYLSKAVKLNPHDLTSWTSLGNCFWKKGALEEAQHCFLTCLEYGEDIQAYRDLSMILRQVGHSSLEKEKNVAKSVEMAKLALKMNMQDGQSWYILGNAYLALFFCSSHSPADLQRAYKAYNRAESNGAGENPDLHYNRANVCRYKEEYAQAISGYTKASTLDPSLPAEEAIEGILRWVTRVNDLIHRKGRLKAKKLEALVSSFPPPSSSFIAGRQVTSVSQLSVGANPGKVIILKLLLDVVRSNEPPGCFVMLDVESSCLAVSVYHLDNTVSSKLSDKDFFSVLDPMLVEIQVETTALTVQYPTLQVADPRLFLVNGKMLSGSYAPAQVQLNNFDL